MLIEGNTNEVIEWDYHSSTSYSDPFSDITLDVTILSPEGTIFKIPAFWRGEMRWSVRFATSVSGTYRVKSICSDTHNRSLHHIEHTLHISTVDNQEPNIRAPYLHVSNGMLQTADGAPFFWFADTWWMGLSSRLHFPDEFVPLVKERKEKGFSVIQLVAGLFPDMDDFDPRAANEAGLPWEAGYKTINPSYFDKADARIAMLVGMGIVPCIVGAWGYYILSLGEKRMRQHWRYIIARWGAYPVAWCAAGEATMPFYLSENGPKAQKKQIALWTKLTRYIKQTDPYKRPLTIHPTDTSTTQLSDTSLLDFNMIQAGHGGYPSISNAVRLIGQERKTYPKLPLVMGELNYERIMHDTHAEQQRLSFWKSMLSGASGYSYGANGLWQANRKELPFGASPHGGTWGNAPWQEAAAWEGSHQLGIAKKLLERYTWWDMAPHPEWLSPLQHTEDPRAPVVAGIPGVLRIIYFYGPLFPWGEPKLEVVGLEKGADYWAFFFDPRTGKEYPLGTIVSKRGKWMVPVLPTFDDWVLILTATNPKPSKRTLAKSLKNYLLRWRTLMGSHAS